jgi:hypothetical protein
MGPVDLLPVVQESESATSPSNGGSVHFAEDHRLDLRSAGERLA